MLQAWWNNKCQNSLTNYKSSKTIEDWRIFKEVIKKTKHIFFNDKIQDKESQTMSVVVTTSLRTTNRPLSKLKKVVSCRDHKRT